MTPPAPTLSTPHRLHRRAFFWQVHVTGRTAHVLHGRQTAPGRPSTKLFPTHAKALFWATAAIAEKQAAGYTNAIASSASPSAAPPSPTAAQSPTAAPRRSTRKRAAPDSYAPPAQRTRRAKNEPKSDPSPAPPAPKAKRAAGKVKRGLRGQPAVDVTAPLGVVDPASGSHGLIYTASDDNGQSEVCDVMLVLFDKAKHHDKFIVLQLIHEPADNKFLLYQRWGRTGTSGSSLSQRFTEDNRENALAAFADKFLQKTGLEWQHRDDAPVPGKYRFVKQDFEAKYNASVSPAPRWQYWVDDGVDGKVTGWYDYDAFGNGLVEQLYMEFQNNQWLTERIVASGMYAYLVNLESMTQTNVVHTNHTMRHIRRVPPNELPDNEDPTGDFPGTAITPITAFNMTTKKPNVLPVQTKPAHKVEPAPPAVVPAPPTAKAEPESTPAAESPAEVVIPVDDLCPSATDYKVVEDFDATLNQSNIMDGNNNNKYYKLQMLEHKKSSAYHVWTRWGRVGESRGTQTKLMGPFKEREAAEKTFNKKFKDKTANNWSDRSDFEPQIGKYELLEIDHTAKKEENTEPLVMTLMNEQADVEYLPSKLAKETRELIELLFEKDVYTDAMKAFDIDVRKMPLGALSTDQIQKGVAVLEEIEEAQGNSVPRAEIERLSSKFYTTLPHDFGRRRPPPIATKDMLQRCYDMCNVLLDMEKATTLMSAAEEKTSEQKAKKQVPHPTEAQYASLNAALSLVDAGSEEHEVVAEAFNRTKGDYATSKLLNVWRVERVGEAERFREVQKLDNHLLLWHGSHIGAISAILSTGLRIMPHSGGRVGRGIYLASENGKSQQYTTPASRNMVGCMFLAEAALGKMCEILQDNSDLKKAPKGFDSVLACGRQTPGGFKDVTLDDVKVKVPVQAPKDNPKATDSSFFQDEYLIYNEAQARIRYVITVHKGNMY